MTDFCTRLKEERKRLGLNQSAFGAIAGVSKDAQLNYESGSRTPDATYLQAIAGAGVDALYLLTGSATPRSGVALTTDAAALLESYEQASPAGRAALQAVALLSRDGSAEAKGGTPAAVQVTIGGDVGQSIGGDQNNSAPVSFSVSKKRK